MSETNLKLKNLIDTHCHLSHKRFGGDVSGVLARGADAGLVGYICAAGNLEESRSALTISQNHAAQNVYCTAGVHPHDAVNVSAEVLCEVEELLKQNRCVALGEIGLDYHYDYSPRDHQRRAFAEQLEIILSTDLPVVIHTREAFDETLAILAESGIEGSRVLFHSFTSGPAEAERALEIGASISYSGIATFKSADDIRQAVAITPADRIMIETDAPYLSPEPVRKVRTNEPANVAHVATRLAELCGMTVEQFATKTTENAIKFFKLDL